MMAFMAGVVFTAMAVGLVSLGLGSVMERNRQQLIRGERPPMEPL